MRFRPSVFLLAAVFPGMACAVVDFGHCFLDQLSRPYHLAVVYNKPPTVSASRWLMVNADHSIAHTVKMRNPAKPDQLFPFFTIGSERAREGYLEKVVPRTVAIGFVFGRPQGQAHLSKIHTYVRVGEFVYEVDTPTAASPDNGRVRKIPVKEYFQSLYDRSDHPTFHESVLDVGQGEKEELTQFYDAVRDGKLKVNGRNVGTKYDLMGLGQTTGDNLEINCFSLSLLFGFPHLTQSFPNAAKFAQRNGLTLPPEEQGLGHLIPASFSTMIQGASRDGFVSLGANVLTEGNPPGNHAAAFFDPRKNPLAKKMGVKE